MKHFAVIDTNIIVSGLLSSHYDSATVQVIGRLFSGQFIPVFSEEILREYNEVLRRKKFHFTETVVARMLNTIELYGELIVPAPTGEILPDMKDLPFYEATMSKREDNAYLITGNMKHFPSKQFIVTAHDFLEILNKEL